MPTPSPRSLIQVDGLPAAADCLGCSTKQLAFLLHGRAEDQRYAEFLLPKRRDGFRTILAPREDLKRLQRTLAAHLAQICRRRNSVHGFLRGRSIVTNAKKHVRRRFVLNVDLKDFFPSINFGRVRGLFIKLGVSPQGATVLAQVCCHNGTLPQGAPTSPIVSNMICAKLDRQLGELAKAHQCVYTRYADDLTFSRRKAEFPVELGYRMEKGKAYPGAVLKALIESNGFIVNDGKVWLYDNRMRQTVTGLTVNRKCNVPRKFIRQIRAMIHAWKVYGHERAQAMHASRYYRRSGKLGAIPPYELILRGKLEFVKMVKGAADPVYRNLQSQFCGVCPEYESVMWKENQQMDARDAFISHASEDKDEIARPLAKALVNVGLTVWYDEYELSVGDSLRMKIEEGLSKARFGIVVLSKAFFSKRWPQQELNGLAAKQDVSGQKVILPIWHGLDKQFIVTQSPMLADLLALDTSKHSLHQIIARLSGVIRPNRS
jgi:RNA-directed DNA polymerase